jgi:aarF domain-containing kinase
MRWHGGGPRDDDAYDAWQSRGRRRIGQAFSVITRGAEIAARLSPLAILVPVAVVASYVDLTARGITRDNEIGRRAIEEGAGGGGANDDEFAPPRFRESNSSRRGDRRLATTTTTTTTTWASDLAWRYALFTLQRLGPAFVKLGQWAATRRDLFPVHFCDRLSRLHDAARVHDWRHTHEALVDAFGEDYESRGLVVVRNDGGGGGGIGIGVGEYRGILGSGSAAQVHIGTLCERAVAVKVLHPNTRQLVERDLEMMRHLADFVEYIFPFEAVRMLSLPRAVSNFASVMERQVDLRIEGDNLLAFRENFGCISAGDDDDVDDAPPPTITFPRPEPGWVSERVLVEEHAGDDAVPISSYLFDDSPEGLRTRKELARPLLLAFLKMVFIDNFIHADLHPG